MRIIVDNRTMKKSVDSLSAREAEDVRNTIHQLSEDHNHPSLRLHPVKESRDSFYTVRMNKGGRLVLHINKDVMIVCKAFSRANHDDAYRYARSRMLKGVGSTLEYVPIVDHVTPDEEYAAYDEAGQPDELERSKDSLGSAERIESPEQFSLFIDFSDNQIEECGVTLDELKLVRRINSEEKLFLLEESFSPLVHDNLVAMYLGDELPHKLADGNLVASSDELRFIEYDGSDEVKEALFGSWESWQVFLSNSQLQTVNASFKGPSKVFGGAGTGKTVVALHRAKFLIQNRALSTRNGVGLITFSRVLANDLQSKMDLLVGADTDARKKVHVAHLEEIAHKVIGTNIGPPFELTTDYTIRTELTKLHQKYGLDSEFTPDFVVSEFMNVIGPWGLWDFVNYKNFNRLGRQTPLGEKQREILSELFAEFRQNCEKQRLITQFEFYQKAADIQSARPPFFDHLIIDETQDLGPHMLTFVRSLVDKKPDDIMLCGDTGQSLYTRHHSFRRHGFEVQGRSKKLYVNYRTSQQIKETADKVNEFLLELSDDPHENRRSISIFSGPQPVVELFNDRDAEMGNLGHWVKTHLNSGIQPHEIIVLSPHNSALNAASNALNAAGIKCWKLDSSANYLSGEVGLAVVRRVKGLEYRSVAIIGCDEDQFPNENKMNELGDGSDFDEFLTLEKNSLYVAMTRARDNLLVSGITPGSAFLEELA